MWRECVFLISGRKKITLDTLVFVMLEYFLIIDKCKENFSPYTTYFNKNFHSLRQKLHALIGIFFRTFY